VAVYVPKNKSPEIILNSKSDLAKLSKLLKDEQEYLVKSLITFVKAEDSDKKMVVETSKYLLDLSKSVSESIQKENITRLLVAEKLNGGNKQQSIANDYQQPRAVLSLDIQRTDGIEYDELNKDDNSFDLRSVGSFESK